MNTSTHPSTAKDVFWYLLLIAMLYTSIVSFIAIVWQSINIWLPDALSFSYTNSSDILLSSMATLIIAWPVVLVISWLINKDLVKHPVKQHLWVRRWLLSLTLFTGALTMIIDLVSLTTSFFNGELTMRFFLKVLTVLLVAAVVFGYYLWQLRRDPSKPTKIMWAAAAGATGLIIVWIGLGFSLTGSPSYQRDLRIDEQRVQDLQTIQWQIISYWQDKDRLPSSLADLTDAISGFVAPTDPETGMMYVYTQEDDLTFTLCAMFQEASRGDQGLAMNIRYFGESMALKEDSWEHEAGEVCFERTIDPEVYTEEKHYSL